MNSYYEEYKDLSKENINTFFVSACFNGDINRVKYLLNSSELRFNANPHYQDDAGFRMALNHDYIDIVKYLTNSNEIKKPVDLKIYAIEVIRLACNNLDYEWVDELIPFTLVHNKKSVWSLVHDCCQTGNLNMVRYLLESPKWGNQVNIDNGIFNSACRGNNIELIDYLLNSQWKDIFDIHDDYDLPFITCCESESLELAKYFIFNLNIEKSFPIAEYLKENDCEFNRHIQALFLKKELNQSLEFGLESKEHIKNKRNKI